MSALMKWLWLPLLAVFVVGSSDLLASPDDDEDDDDASRDSLTADFGPIPPSKGRGDGQYMELQSSGRGGGISTVLNANSRVALAKLDGDGNVIAILNTHLAADPAVGLLDDYPDIKLTLFIGEDEDGDGTCLQEGPHAICALLMGENTEVNDDNILHAAAKLAVRTEGGKLKGNGTCWTDFDDVQVIPLTDELGNMIGVEFVISGGTEGMPDIEEDDGSIVGFDAPWLFDTECKAGTRRGDTVCAVVPFLTTDESLDTGGEPWDD
jgi:hypothetical protein